MKAVASVYIALTSVFVNYVIFILRVSVEVGIILTEQGE